MELLNLSKQEFSRISRIVYEHTGIHLGESKLNLLSNRLRKRLTALGLNGFSDYCTLLQNASKCVDELPHFLSAVTTNETYFFRNDRLWEFFRDDWIPQMLESKKTSRSIRIWSAASSSGEEAYTTAICLSENVPSIESWRVRILGTDISPRVLEKAQEGLFHDYSLSRTSDDRKLKWFDQVGDGFRLKPIVRKLVQFQSHNLRDPLKEAPFDLIFLRNVLMYFDLPMKLIVLQNVQAALAPGGTLVVGDVDPIRNTRELSAAVTLEAFGPNLYRKPEAGARNHSALDAASAGGNRATV